MSALPPKADIEWRLTDVCFVPIADIHKMMRKRERPPHGGLSEFQLR